MRGEAVVNPVEGNGWGGVVVEEEDEVRETFAEEVMGETLQKQM